MKNSRGLGGVCVLAAVMGMSGAAVAQDAPRGDRPTQRDGVRDLGRMLGGGAGQDQIQEGDVDLMESVLSLDEPQRQLARELFADLREQRAALMTELREQMQGLRGEGERPDREAMEKFRAVAEEAREKAAELERLFYEDIQLVLTPEQREGWSKFEQRRDRARALRGVSGAVDIGVAYERFVEKYEPRAEENALAGASALADRFSSEMDRQIAERAKLLEQGRPDGQGGFDRDAMREMFEARREAEEKITEISTRYADSIERTLPMELREAFRFEVNRLGFGAITRSGNVVERLEAAMSGGGLDAAQKQELAAIEVEMHKRYNALAKEMAEMRAQARERRGEDSGRGQRGRDRGGEGNAEGSDLRQRMQAIEDELSTRMRAVLGDGDA